MAIEENIDMNLTDKLLEQFKSWRISVLEKTGIVLNDTRNENCQYIEKSKQEIALTVSHYIREWTFNHVYLCLKDGDLHPAMRLSMAFDALWELYSGGMKTQMIQVLYNEMDADWLVYESRKSLEEWIDAFVQLGLDLGCSKSEALQWAEKSIVEIQQCFFLPKNDKKMVCFFSVTQKIEKRYLSYSKNLVSLNI